MKLDYKEKGQLGVRKGAWTHEEDSLLRKCIQKYGEGNWHQVPPRAGLNRCRKSCRLRWLNYLHPNIKRGRFADDEIDLMIRLHKLLGNRWSLIAGRLPGRTANEIKNYWNTNFKKKLVNQESKQKLNQPKIVEIIKPQPLTFSKQSIRIRGQEEEEEQQQQQQQKKLSMKEPLDEHIASWKNLVLDCDFEDFFGPDGDLSSGAKAEGSLNVRPTTQTEKKVCLREKIVPSVEFIGEESSVNYTWEDIEAMVEGGGMWADEREQRDDVFTRVLEYDVV